MESLFSQLPSSTFIGIAVITLLQIVVLFIIIRDLVNYIDTFSNNSKYKIKHHTKTYITKVSPEQNDSTTEKNLFSDSEVEVMSSYEYLSIEIDESKTNQTGILIFDSINKYLKGCKGQVSDYNVVKDIVERNCESKEQEIIAIQPFPTYIGLIGTMFGIILGVVTLLMSQDIEVLTSFTEYENFDGVGLKALLGGVGVAMVTSLFGLLISMIATMCMRSIFSSVESKKNSFYTWFQSKLLPEVSGDLTSSLNRLQQNLAVFNESFSSNVNAFDKSFKVNVEGFHTVVSDIEKTSVNQIDLISRIQEIDFFEIAEANIKLMKQLENSANKIDKFSRYLDNVDGYLGQINVLNTNLNDQLERTLLIENIAKFFESELHQIEIRKSLITDAVGLIDDHITKSLENLKDFTDNSYLELQASSAESYKRYSESIQNQKIMFIEEVDEINVVIDELKSLGKLHGAIDTLVLNSNEQNEKFDNLRYSIDSLVEVLKKSDPSQNECFDVDRQDSKELVETVLPHTDEVSEEVEFTQTHNKSRYAALSVKEDVIKKDVIEKSIPSKFYEYIKRVRLKKSDPSQNECSDVDRQDSKELVETVLPHTDEVSEEVEFTQTHNEYQHDASAEKEDIIQKNVPSKFKKYIKNVLFILIIVAVLLTILIYYKL